MKNAEKRLSEWRERYYRVERDYARRIVLSPKNSVERERLFQDGYNAIARIIDDYDPAAGETGYTDVAVAVIRRRVRRGGHVLDIGCSSASLLYELAVLGYEITGIDVSNESIEKARKRLSRVSKSESVSQSEVMSYNPGDVFDCIVMDNVIEHIHPDTIRDVMKKCHSMLREEGCVLIITPHRFSGPHDISKYFLPLGAKAEGFHLREFSFADLHTDLIESGFREVLGFPYHPRLLRKLKVIPDCSLWAGRKAIFFERLFQESPLRGLLRINATMSRMIVAVLFPAVCVAKK